MQFFSLLEVTLCSTEQRKESDIRNSSVIVSIKFTLRFRTKFDDRVDRRQTQHESKSLPTVYTSLKCKCLIMLFRQHELNSIEDIAETLCVLLFLSNDCL